MSEHTNIEWCDATFNPWIGCTKVSPACDHCYAERDFDLRRHVVQWGAGQARKRTAPANWKKPFEWNKQEFVECPECGWRGEWRAADARNGCCPSCNHLPRLFKPARRRVFCGSLADVFDNEVPAEWRADLMQLIVSTPNLDWLLLTKRIGNAERLIAEAGDLIDYGDGWQSLWGQGEWPRNVWLGATICNQTEADRDIPKLLSTPAAARFVSIEPMLGPIDLHSVIGGTQWIGGQRGCTGMHHGDGSRECPSELHHHHDERCGRGLDWVIVGGESGPKARPMHPEWAQSLRDQCAAAGVPFLFKQWGEWCPRSACYHTFQDGRSLADEDPGATRWPCIRLNENGSDGRRLENEDGGSSAYMQRIGKKAAGRLLDGVEHDGFPRGAE